MSTALERRLRRAFDRLPQPTREATRRARATALATLPTEERRGELVVVLAAAAVAVILGAGAAALAATGNLHVRLGQQQPRREPPPAHLQVPAGTDGIAVAAGGRVWLATRNGLRIEGMPASAVELSPHALYAAVGVGSSLVALAPGRRRAWAHDAGGRVVAAAWSPDGLKVAYVVQRSRHDELRLIEGDGDHDRLLDPVVGPAKPSWRADALAVAYIGAGRRPTVYDLGANRRRAFDTSSCGGSARAVAYSPGRRRLAVAATNGVAVIGRWDRRPACVGVRGIDSFAWAGQAQIVVSDHLPLSLGPRSAVRRFALDSADQLAEIGQSSSKRLRGIVTAPAGRRFAVAVKPKPGLVDLYLASWAKGPLIRLVLGQPLLRLRAGGAASLSWR